MKMNGLIMRDFHRERFTDPTARISRGDSLSPTKPTEFVETLRNKTLDFSLRNSESIIPNSDHRLPEDSLKHIEQDASPDDQSNRGLNTSVDEAADDRNIEKDNVLDKSVDEDSFNGRYNRENSNSSDLDSDIDRDELIPNSPRHVLSSKSSIDYYQHLPSNLPFRADFSSEEANLRARLKDFGSPPFGEEEYRQRLSFPDGKNSHLVHPNSSPTGSPRCKTLQGSPISPYRRLPRSADELDETLTPNIREGLYFCHLCSFSGTTQGAFDQHMTVHFEHVCPHCDYKSRTEGRLKRHIKDFHTEDPDGGYGARTMPGRPKVFRCKQCEFSTTDKVEFWSHSRTHIKEDKLLQCPRCPFVTEYKHHLEYHLRNHFGSKPFKCPKCNYACVNKSMLNSHMKSHTNVYQYRCADCTYATKYCHSLKLHLRKYNHKPAAVLNSDGSLPQGVDATASGLSLLSKRGPPRGPRGPRKDKMDVGPPGAPHFPLPPSPMGPMPGLPGMISPFWPMLPGQLPNSLPTPLGLGARFPSHLPGLPGLSSIKKEDLTSSIPISSADIKPFKCNYCSFVGTSREVLTSHVMKVHGSDNQDLFSLFGIHSESLLSEKTRMNAISSLTSPLKSPRMNFFPPSFSPSHGIKREHPDTISLTSHEKSSRKESILSPYSFMNGKYSSQDNGKDEGIDILKQMTLKFGSGPFESPKKPKVQIQQGDAPLDLTKPRNSPSPVSTDVQSPNDNKHEDGNQSSGENSVYSNEVTSPTPRKRSRKGKAFKLDTLCMKLQEQQRPGIDSDDESIELDDYPSVTFMSSQRDKLDQGPEEVGYTSKAYDDTIPKEMSKVSEGNTIDSDQTKYVDEMEEENGEMEEDFKKIHSSLEMLNQNGTDGDHKLNSAISNRYSYDLVIKEEKTDEVVKKEAPVSPVVNGNHNRRKSVPAALQRGLDISWKLFNDPNIVSNLIKNDHDQDYKENCVDDDKDVNVDNDDDNDDDQPADDQKNGEFECPHCKISFFDCIMYTMHMGYHGYKDPYTCNMCGDVCKDRVQFNLHIARAAHN